MLRPVACQHLRSKRLDVAEIAVACCCLLFVAGSAQLIKPAKNNEAQSHSCILSTFFFASWARGFGLAKAVFQKAELKAKEDGFKVINLEVRETQLRAIQLYEQAGYVKSGMNPKSVYIDGKYIAGYYYYKELK